MPSPRTFTALTTFAALLGAAACATLAPAQMALPATLAWDRLGATDALTGAAAARCTGRQTSAGPGLLSAAPRPYEVHCRGDTGDGQRAGGLTPRAAAGGTLNERSGHFSAGGVTPELHSVHHLQGSPLALDALQRAVTHAALTLALPWHPATAAR